MFRMVFSLTPWARAILRVLQCVLPGGVVVSVAFTMAATHSGMSRFWRPGRDASRTTPLTPRRHVAMHPVVDMIPTHRHAGCNMGWANVIREHQQDPRTDCQLLRRRSLRRQCRELRPIGGASTTESLGMNMPSPYRSVLEKYSEIMY
jgi:hypothetical protein